MAASSLCGLLAAALPGELGSQPARPASAPKTYRYHPTQRVPPSLEALQKQLVPGTDAFPDEKEASEIGQRLAAFSAELKQHVDRAAIAADTLMTPSFKGARLTSPDEESVDSGSSLEIRRSRTLMSEFTLDRATFKKELTSLLSEFASIETAEFLVTAIEVTRAPTVSAVSTIRFDLI